MKTPKIAMSLHDICGKTIDIEKLRYFPVEHHNFIKALLLVDLETSSVVEMHKKLLRSGAFYFLNTGSMPPPDFQRLVLWAMLCRRQLDGEVLSYVASLI